MVSSHHAVVASRNRRSLESKSCVSSSPAVVASRNYVVSSCLALVASRNDAVASRKLSLSRTRDDADATVRNCTMYSDPD